MSNGDPSRSPYIIICNGRTNVALARNSDDKVAAASNCAAAFAPFMETAYGSDDFGAELVPITTIQHELMDHAIGTNKLSNVEIDQKIADLFEAMTAMEHGY